MVKDPYKRRFGYRYQGAKHNSTKGYTINDGKGGYLIAKRNDKLHTRDYYTPSGVRVDRKPIEHHSYGYDKRIKHKKVNGKTYYYIK